MHSKNEFMIEIMVRKKAETIERVPAVHIREVADKIDDILKCVSIRMFFKPPEGGLVSFYSLLWVRGTLLYDPGSSSLDCEYGFSHTGYTKILITKKVHMYCDLTKLKFSQKNIKMICKDIEIF